MSENSSANPTQTTNPNLLRTAHILIPPQLKFVMNSIKTIVTTQLTADNHPIWKSQVLKLFTANGFEGYLDGSISCPTTSPDHPLWLLIDQNLAAALCSTISPSATVRGNKYKYPKMTSIHSLPLAAISQILLLTLLASIKSLANSPEKPTPAFFIFGDSAVDAGNNNYIDTIKENRANLPPYGRSGFFGKPTGRYSDGRVLVDFIAEYAKLPLIPPSKQPSAEFINGVNFAAGGAGVLPETYQGIVIDFPTQLEQFNTVVSSLTEELGDTKARELIADAVYFFSIGGNDYLCYFESPKMQEVFTPEDIVGMVIGNLSKAIQELYEKGARKFGFLSVSPLGCLPALRAANPKADGSCFEDVSALTLAHNNALYGVLLSFEHILTDFKYAFSSGYYSWLLEVIHNPAKFGFKDGMNACCGSGTYGGVYSCGENKEPTSYTVCDSAEDFVWWDSFHGTEKLAKKIADALWDDPPNSVGPYNLKGLFFNHEKSRVEDIEDAKENLEAFAM